MPPKILNGLRSLTSTAASPDPRSLIEELNAAKDAAALVDWGKSQYKAAKSARVRYERQWALNMSFYRGQQYMQYMPSGTGSQLAGRLFTPPSPSWTARTVTNRIRPIIRTEMARLTSNKPNASVVPASSEDVDLFAAQAAEQVWNSLYSGYKLHKTFSTAMFWMTICGTSFIKDWWDPGTFDTFTKAPGKIESAAVTPYHLFVPDLFEPEIENQEWVINAYTKSVNYVEAAYGIKVNPTVVEAKSPFDEAMLSAAMGTNEAKPDSVLVIEVWAKPNVIKQMPNGGMFTIAGDVLVTEPTDGLPYEHGEYPFTKFDHIETGMFYAESVITDLIAPQREYNRTKNQIVDAKNRMAKPQLMAPRGSVDASKITTQPGQVIEYRQGFNPPSPLPLQPLPSYVLNQLDLEIRDMEDISSQHQVSRGQAPPGVTAATAISFMQERDDSLMTGAYQSVEFGWEKWAKHHISHAVQFWDAERTISVTGVDGSFDAIVLKGTQLSSGTDIRIEAGSALPISKAAKQAFLMDMMKMNFIPPEKGLELMDMGGIDQLYDELKMDERAAQRENLRMQRLDIEQIFQHQQQVEEHNFMIQQQQQQAAQEVTAMIEQDPQLSAQHAAGVLDPMSLMPPQEPEMPMNMVPVNTWDNHQVHIDVHNRFRKSQAFDLLPNAIKEQFEFHVMMHAQALNAAAEAAMMMPPPPGGMGANNGSGTPMGDDPVGSNQFGPPGTEDGAPPPEMMG